MNGIRSVLRKKVPSSTAIKVLRKVFAMPAPAARLLLNDISRPRKSHKPWILKVPWNNDWSGCWIAENIHKIDPAEIQSRVDAADVILFNVHGGGFRIGNCTMYMDTNIAWLTVLKEKYGLTAMIMSIDYRLAPEYRYPSPVEDVVRAYECLTQTMGVPGEKIIAIGDSAGAALILEMLFITHDPSMFEIVTDDPEDTPSEGGPMLSELPRPAGTILVSPLVTDETTSESWRVNVEFDFITQHTAKVIKRDYYEPHNEDPDTPPESNRVLGIAKLQTGFQAFLSPNVLMYIGNKEVLRDDALDVAEKAEQDGVNWQTVVEDCVHDWFCVREVVKDHTILERADSIFADFVYRSVIQPRETEHALEALSFRRQSEGLEVVLEDDEDDDEDDEVFHEAMTGNELSLDKAMMKKLDALGINDPEAKRSTLTVYV
ncbi:Alpha/Beta hydrolase protein [Phycomyces nitens]|nr:Alpha/Beta hydrolase protein [Phycomyces nitens]